VEINPYENDSFDSIVHTELATNMAIPFLNSTRVATSSAADQDCGKHAEAIFA